MRKILDKSQGMRLQNTWLVSDSQNWGHQKQTRKAQEALDGIPEHKGISALKLKESE